MLRRFWERLLRLVGLGRKKRGGPDDDLYPMW